MESSTRRPPRSQHRNVRCLAVSPYLVSSSGLTFCLFLSHLIESSADCQLLLQWVQAQLDDATIFPTEQDVPFPQDFREIVGNLFRRLFRVYAHVYHSHMERVVELSFEAHLNSCFKHFLYFVLEVTISPIRTRLLPSPHVPTFRALPILFHDKMICIRAVQTRAQRRAQTIADPYRAHDERGRQEVWTGEYVAYSGRVGSRAVAPTRISRRRDEVRDREWSTE